MAQCYQNNFLKVTAMSIGLVVAASSASALTYNYNQYVTGVDLGTSTVATLQVVQVGADVEFTLTNTGAGGAKSWIDYIDFTYAGDVESLVLTDAPDAWTVAISDFGNGKNAGYSFDGTADVAPNGSSSGLSSGNSTSWMLVGVLASDFTFVSPGSMIHVGGLGENGEGSTKYLATIGGGGGGFNLSEVPLPAALPLLASALAVFAGIGAMRSRKRRT